MSILRIFSPRSRVVKKDEYADSGAAEFGTPERVEFHLHNWSRWMHTGKEVRGLPNATIGTINWSIFSAFEDMIEKVDRGNAAVVDVIIREDLTVSENAAVHHRYGLVRTFQSGNIVDLLESAKIKIGKSLVSRSIY